MPICISQILERVSWMEWDEKIKVFDGICEYIGNPVSNKIWEALPAFIPASNGSRDVRANLALQAAHQVFPFFLETLRTAGRNIPEPVDIQTFSSSGEGVAAAARLKSLLDKYGSDKAIIHDYHVFYGEVLKRPNDIKRILEVGLGTNNEDITSNMGREGKPGASLRAFRDYLPGAQVFGADIDRNILFEEERITTFFVDQTDLRSVDALCQQIPEDFDLIIDDGLHCPNANMAILTLGMKKVAFGGWIVIEDIRRPALSIWQVVSATLPDGWESYIFEAKERILFAVRRTEGACG